MPTVAAYSIQGPLYNLLRRPEYKPVVRTLDQVRRQLRKGNHKTTTGRGARQRSSYEHEIDVSLYLHRAMRAEGTLVSVIRHHCRRWKRKVTLATGRRTCGCRVVTIDPYKLMHAQVPARARAVHDMRRKLRVALDWADRNGPGSGWARRQSERRAHEQETATRFQLPRRSWTAFYLFRAVTDVIVGMLLALWDWWETLITAPRLASREAKLPEKPDGVQTREQSRSAECSDRGPWTAAELVRRELRNLGM